MLKAKVGIIGLGHYIYFNQFAGLEQELKKKTDEFLSDVDGEKCNKNNYGYVDCVDEAFSKVKELKKEDLDLLFIIMTTYVPSAVAAPFIKYIDAPQVLVGIQPLSHLDYENTTTFMQLVNDDICAMPEVAGVYRRIGKKIPPCIIASSKQKDYIKKEVGEWIDAANAMAVFKYETIGYLGHTYEGMYDMHTDPTAFFATFGAHVKMLEMCDLADIADKVTEEETENEIKIIKDTFIISEPSIDPITDYVKDEDLNLSAKLSCALKKLVKENHLVALAYFYKGLNNKYEEIAANLTVGNTLLTSADIPLAGEADLKTAAAMLIMNRIGGGGSFAEIHPFDIESNVVLIGHDGPHNIAIAKGKPILRKLKKYHGKSGSGIGVEFSLKNGPVTMVSINVDDNGKFRMIAATGESEAGKIPQTGNTNTKVYFNQSINDFLKKWCEAGPTHHVALGIGNKIDVLEKFSFISGIELKIIK